MMMFPIALSVIHVMKSHEGEGKNMNNFSLVLMLVIAYASNIGGMATIIGTPPNVAFAAYIEKNYQYNIQFGEWMLVCFPLAILLLFAIYWLLAFVLFPVNIRHSNEAANYVKNELTSLGPVSKAEKRVMIVFCMTALLWIFKDLIKRALPFSIDDTQIALLGMISLFIIPAGHNTSKTERLLEWSDTSKMAWGILLLFGGGIALAGALESAGIIQQIGNQLAGFGGENIFILLLIIVAISVFLSELMSNVAQVIVFAPVLGSLADALHINPLLLGIPMTLAASAAAMLPMGTPPNAIVFGSGHIPLRKMIKAGFAINLICILFITLFCFYLLPFAMKHIQH
jgi:sodium-dependent dicarboxylate transporter 2/3/5